jgi:hypothetical protein
MVILLILIIVGPLAINWLFKQKAPIEVLVAEWDASAALEYYGAVIGAAIAVYGVFLTIRYSQKNYKEDVRNRTLPFITLTMLKTKSYKKLFPVNAIENRNREKEEGYFEYKLQDYYCILENGMVGYQTGLSERQQEILNNAGTKWVSSPSGGSLVVVNDICVPIEIENVGNGTAIRLRYGLNKKGISEKDRRYLPVISLKPENPILLHIFSEDCSKESNNLGEYILSFYYEDIFSNRYKQDFEVMIEYNDVKNCPMVSVDMSHKQNFLGEKYNE